MHLYLKLGQTFLILALFVLQTAAAAPVARNGPFALDDADTNATPDLIAHDIGNLRTTLSNYGEYANPNNRPGFAGMEYPINSGNDFLFSAGIWVGAIVNDVRLVSTATDGDNGTGEFFTVHVGTIPAENENDPDWYLSSRFLTASNGKHFVRGAHGVDDDGDWNPVTDDLDGDLMPSENWDGGWGFLNYDDDGDGMIDEESADGLDNDADGEVDEDTDSASDANGDGNAGYDPEPHIDEDPPGDMSADHLDNDHDGLADADDPDHDGDCCLESLDDDGDGLEDEDAAARGDQEFFCVYQDSIQPQYVSSPDVDGHTPLDIEVTQRSTAWSDSLVETVILLEYTVRNMSANTLEDVHLAFFSDSDIRAQGEGGDAASLDDKTYCDQQRRMMVTYDDLEDNDGPGPGVFAIKAVVPPISWENASFTYRNYERVSGGDPELNSDKFQVMSSGTIDPPSPQFGDWRTLIAWGSQDGTLSLAPGQILSFSVAMFAAADTGEARQIADELLRDVISLPVRERTTVATDYALYQNFPNPFNPTTTIGFDLARTVTLRLTVYDVTGRKVVTLLSGRADAGRHSVTFDGSLMASGAYFYTLKADHFSDVKKMILIR